MAEVTIKLTDGDKGVLIELMSVPTLPKANECGSIAQNLAMIVVENIHQEVQAVTGKACVKVVRH